MVINFKNKDIISITDLTKEDILYLCELGKRMYDLEKSSRRYELTDSLENKALASLFYEPSTRTRTRFNTAMRELGGHYDGFSGTEGTSVMKKETIRDTIKMYEANHFDAAVMRHPLDGSVQWAADVADIPIINGGDGKNEHPTQALLDTLTLYVLNNSKLDGLDIGFGGDLSHGRTIRSLSLALSHFDDITIKWAAEDFLGMPGELEDLLKSRGVKVVRENSVKDVVGKVNAYYMTRPQLERMKNVTQDMIIKMIERYRINVGKVKDSDLILLHPLPVNSEIAEIDYLVYFRPCQKFFPQAEFGVLLSKALLYAMLSRGDLRKEDYTQFSGKLNPDLEFGNNRLGRKIRRKRKQGLFIDRIRDGTVIDNLVYGSAIDIAQKLNLKNRFNSVPADLYEEKRSFIKTNKMDLAERELKKIAVISPKPTVNYIRNGRVIEKFIYLLCDNDNCVTREINEDVPPKFYYDGDTLRCRYCRRVYEMENPKVLKADLRRYRSSLPKGINQILN